MTIIAISGVAGFIAIVFILGEIDKERFKRECEHEAEQREYAQEQAARRKETREQRQARKEREDNYRRWDQYFKRVRERQRTQ